MPQFFASTHLTNRSRLRFAMSTPDASAVPSRQRARKRVRSSLIATWGLASGVCLGGTLFPHQHGAALAVVVGSLLVALARGTADTDVPEEVSALQTAERWAPLCVVLFFLPVLTHVVAPGADMAMHAALSRALRDDLPVLSPAWGSVRASAYPLGFSAWIAIFGTLVDLGAASTLASACAFALYYHALQRFFATVLAAPYPKLLAAFLLLASWSPQAFYRWGGGPSVLAMALSLLAAAELRQLRAAPGAFSRAAFVTVLLTAAMATHPIGASIGSACSGLVWLHGCTRARQPLAALSGVVFVPLLLLMAWLSLAGPALSQREHTWIYHFRTVDENVLGTWPRWLFPLTVWRALAVRIGAVVSVCFVASCFALWRRDRRIVWTSLLAIEAFGILLAYGPELPVLGFLIYPSRLMPAATLLMAGPLSAAMPFVPRKGGSLLALSALAVHVGVYQAARPIVTRDDAAVLQCLAEHIPAGAVIDGAYGDATQWIPALTGHAVTHPHEHCSLFDEVDAELAQQRPSYRFVGERVSFGEALPPLLTSASVICERGAARLYKKPDAP